MSVNTKFEQRFLNGEIESNCEQEWVYTAEELEKLGTAYGLDTITLTDGDIEKLKKGAVLRIYNGEYVTWIRYDNG